ncbi:unnamed protein product [Paramecium sonneborni]|uniref:Uncharacterized protein n=1 Tax=Paramecium sonneborni TaxID=65129 RepID=A0A8S1LEY3_9CILI|nr:unnamed protein product [Paramecium sonneborni]
MFLRKIEYKKDKHNQELNFILQKEEKILFLKCLQNQISGKENGYYEAKNQNGGDLWRFPKLPSSKVGKKRRKQPNKIF